MAAKRKFPVECLEDICRHLTGNELLICTLVSSKWNEFIGSTASCMAKIKLNLRWTFKDSVNIETFLQDSKRIYEFVMLQGYYSEQYRNILLTGARRWPYVTAHELNFRSFIDFMDFLRVIEFSVQTLVIIKGEIKDVYEPDTETFDLTFP